MKKAYSKGFFIFAFSCLLAGNTSTAQVDSTKRTKENKSQMKHASGTFEVEMAPQKPDEGIENPVVGRMSLAKQFKGGLKAKSQGQMLAFRADVKGSAGYVALEFVEGVLDGRKGSFVLQHSGIMDRGEPQLTVTVVPDSGTNELEGLTGSMAIKIEKGKHFYEFEYILPEKP